MARMGSSQKSVPDCMRIALGFSTNDPNFLIWLKNYFNVRIKKQAQSSISDNLINLFNF